MELVWMFSNLFLLPVYAFLNLAVIPVLSIPISIVFVLLLSPVPGFFIPLVYSGLLFTIIIKILNKIRRKFSDKWVLVIMAVLFSFFSTVALGILINYNGTIFNYQYGRFFIHLGSPIPFNGYSIWTQSFPFLTLPFKEVLPYYNIIHLPYFLLDWVFYFTADIAILYLVNNRKHLISKLRKVALPVVTHSK